MLMVITTGTLLEAIIAFIGFGLLSLSLFLYQSRTHDEKFFTRFWLSRGLLTLREYVLNRVGFALVIAVILVASGRLTLSFLHR